MRLKLLQPKRIKDVLKLRASCEQPQPEYDFVFRQRRSVQDLIFRLITLKLWSANSRFVIYSYRYRHARVSVPDSLRFLRCLSRRHVAASYWTAASDVAATSSPVNAGHRRSTTVNAAGHRSTAADHGGDRRSTVAVNAADPLTAAGPPVNGGRHSGKEKVTLDDLFLLHSMDGGAKVVWVNDLEVFEECYIRSRNFTFECGKAGGYRLRVMDERLGDIETNISTLSIEVDDLTYVESRMSEQYDQFYGEFGQMRNLV
nr:hypothetical protein [Tanacetum cinerariifolium]